MTATVDLVVVGADEAGIAATIAALRNGRRVLVVIRQAHSEATRRLRHTLKEAGCWSADQITVVTGAEVACADGVHGIEAVVLRDIRTGRLTGINASELRTFGDGMKGLVMFALASGALFVGQMVHALQVVTTTVMHVGLMVLSVF